LEKSQPPRKKARKVLRLPKQSHHRKSREKKAADDLFESTGCQFATRWSGLGKPVLFSTLRKSALGKASLAYENKIRPVLIALLGSEKSPCLKAGNRIEGGGVCR